MNAFRLISWLRRHAWRRENQPAIRRQRTLYAPEPLEPRTVLSAAPFYVSDTDIRLTDRDLDRRDTPSVLLRESAQAYAAHAENQGSVIGHPIPLSPDFDGLSVGTQVLPLPVTSIKDAQGIARTEKLMLDVNVLSFTYEASLQFATFTFTSLAHRDSWTSNPTSAGPSSSDADGANEDAEDKQAEAEYGRTYLLAANPGVTIAAMNVLADAWWSSMAGTRATTPERANMNNSAGSESQESGPSYGRTGTSGNLLADELTTHLVHAEESHLTHTSTSLIASPLASTSTALTDAARRAADEADARLADSWLAGERDDLRSDGESDGMIDLDGVAALRRGRRLPVNSAVQPFRFDPRLARLTDVALLRDAPSLMWELAQLARDALFAADPSLAAGPPGHADEAMLDLLAADVGTLRQSTVAAAPAAVTPAAFQPPSLDAGVALYQAFDEASAGPAEATVAADGNVAGSPSAPEAAVAMRDQ
jgi:hypothetical protein